MQWIGENIFGIFCVILVLQSEGCHKAVKEAEKIYPDVTRIQRLELEVEAV